MNQAINPEKVKSILLFKLRYAGDVLMTTPAIRLLRQGYPEARITMVVNKGTEDVLRHNPHLNQILTIDRELIENAPFYTRLPYEWRVLKMLRKGNYDLSVDFDSGERAAFLALLSRASLRVGLRYPRGLRRLIFNRQVRIKGPLHTVERNLMLIEKTLGLIRKDDRLELDTGPEEDRRMALWLRRHRLFGKDLVVIHPGARFWFKRWPAKKWASLMDILQGELGLSVIITGGGREMEDVRAILSKMKTPVFSLAGQTTILELAALVRKATLFIGNDSGPMHIAAAMGTPVIALFGPTDPSVWKPWGKGHVVISKQVPCSPCKVTHCDMGMENCMEQISIEDVLHTICQYLERPMLPREAVWSYLL
ncbi:MAG: putative lipopolysaccharide heptosyltransferase III [Nitrospirae bacterium]|nr:putative lipopolysaccharide heptosyltransferase III [Nitrospirota bacterium]